MTSLVEIQQLFWRLITAPEGVGAALAADADRGGGLAAAVHGTLRSVAPLDAVARLEIYANMYFFRILDVLKDDHPAVLAVCGDGGFHNLVTDYLLRYPPAHYSLRHAGNHLPTFIRGHDVHAAHPYLADLARLERALCDAFDAADAQVLSASDLATLPAESWPGLRLTLHPSVHLLASDWAIYELRDRVDRAEPPGEPTHVPTHVCVWRQDLEVFHRAVDESEFAALDAARDGACFADLCAVMAGDCDAQAAASQAAAALARWLGRGWITAVVEA